MFLVFRILSVFGIFRSVFVLVEMMYIGVWLSLLRLVEILKLVFVFLWILLILLVVKILSLVVCVVIIVVVIVVVLNWFVVRVKVRLVWEYFMMLVVWVR